MRSCIVDGELIADVHGQPDFLALLHGRHVPTCVYCFDLLELNGSDLREQPLVKRRVRLEALLKRAKCNVIRFSETFPNANDLLAECARLGLEGIVAKPRDAPYRSGSRSGWIKVKTSEWRASNQWRAKFFEKPGAELRNKGMDGARRLLSDGSGDAPVVAGGAEGPRND